MLHIRWEKIGGSSNTTSHPPVNWGTTFYNNQNNPYEHSWAPLGAKIASEIIIPLNGFIILKFPDLDPPQFVSMAIKMKNQNDYYPLTLDDGSPLNREGGSIRKIKEQSAILVEGGKDVVADTSAVDGINFKIK